MKNKTLAVWLTLLLGPVGGHRIYLTGKFDGVAAALMVPSLLGLYGIARARDLGLDDQASWLLMPLIGFTMAACALTAIFYGLMDQNRWNRRFNPGAPPDAPAGASGWLTVGGVAVSLLLGSTVLLASIAFSFQRYFEYQTEAGRATSMMELMPQAPRNTK
jgi:hypothetical protein